MAKLTLEFDFETEYEQHLDAVRGARYKVALLELDGHLRNRVKWGLPCDENQTEEQRKNQDAIREEVQTIRDKLHEVCEGLDVFT